MTRQFLSVKFRPTDAVSYTYHHDGEPVAAGDQVLVPGRGGKGERTVTVHEAGLPKPTFVTKGIIGKAPPPPPAETGKLL